MSWNNQAIIVGSLGADPEMRYSQNGTAVLSFRVATSEKWKDKSTGTDKEETEWHSVVVFGQRASDLFSHLVKGTYVRVEGKLKTESYEKDGQKRYSTKIHASNVSPGSFPKSDNARQPNTQNPVPFGAEPNYEGFGAPIAQKPTNPYDGSIVDVNDLY